MHHDWSLEAWLDWLLDPNKLFFIELICLEGLGLSSLKLTSSE